MKNKLKLISMMSVSLFLLACQSTPKNVSKPQAKPNTLPNLTTQVTTQAVPIVRSQDGVQDIRWTISHVKSRTALNFSQAPALHLNSAQQRVLGNTGCNPIFGTYQIDAAKKTITFDVKAAHMSCVNALSQEADLMDALVRSKYFELKGRELELFDQSRQSLIKLQQR